MRWSVSRFGALVGVVLLTGCSSAQVDDYREKANASCAAAEKRITRIPRPSTPAETAKAAEREIAIRAEVLSHLEELTVPMDLPRATVVIDDLETRQERARAVKKAAERKEESKLRELEEEASRESPAEAQRARDLGLGECAGL